MWGGGVVTTKISMRCGFSDLTQMSNNKSNVWESFNLVMKTGLLNC